MTKLIRLALLLLFPLLLTACNRENANVQRNDEGGVDVSVSLTESEVNDMVTNALSQMANPLLRDPQVDLQAGQIVINGQHDRRDGGGRVEGRVVLAVTVVDGTISTEASEVVIEGFEATDARLAEFNEHFLADFNRRASRADRVTVESVTITDSAIDVKFAVQR